MPMSQAIQPGQSLYATLSAGPLGAGAGAGAAAAALGAAAGAFSSEAGAGGGSSLLQERAKSGSTAAKTAGSNDFIEGPFGAPRSPAECCRLMSECFRKPARRAETRTPH